MAASSESHGPAGPQDDKGGGASPKDSWLLAVADLIVKIVVPVTILVAGSSLSREEKESSKQQQELRVVFDSIEKLASTNERERELAARILNQYATEKKLPAVLLPVLVEQARNDPNAVVARESGQAAATYVSNQQAAAPTPGGSSSDPGAAPAPGGELKAAREALNSLPPRVYIHVRSDEQRQAAQRLEAELERRGFVVPAINQRERGPASSELRFFRKGEEQKAEEITGVLNEMRADVKLAYKSGYEDSKGIRLNHFELWLAPDFGRQQAPAANANR